MDLWSLQHNLGKVNIQMHNDDGELFTAVLRNVLYVPALAERLFSIESLMEAGHECYFRKGTCTMVFQIEQYCGRVTLPFKGTPKGHDPQALPTQI